MRIRVPGKAIVAGEYAVLAGGPAIVCAVDRHLDVEARPSEKWRIEGLGARWEDGDAETPNTLRFACEALRVAAAFVKGKGKEAPAHALVVNDFLRAPDGTKLGLGGSACTSVGVVSAVLASAGFELTRDVVFKLASTAHARVQKPAGSALDVAASTRGGTLFTRRFDVAALVASFDAGEVAFADALDRVPVPEHEFIPAPRGLALAFSGTAASTPELVARMDRFASLSPKPFAEFVARTSRAVDSLRRALVSHDEEGQRTAVAAAAAELDLLQEASGIELVTERHRTIQRLAKEHGAAAKISGAGGGDCCIVVGTSDALGEALSKAGVLYVPVRIDGGGIRLT